MTLKFRILYVLRYILPSLVSKYLRDNDIRLDIMNNQTSILAHQTAYIINNSNCEIRNVNIVKTTSVSNASNLLDAIYLINDDKFRYVIDIFNRVDFISQISYVFAELNECNVRFEKHLKFLYNNLHHFRQSDKISVGSYDLGSASGSNIRLICDILRHRMILLNHDDDVIDLLIPYTDDFDIDNLIDHPDCTLTYSEVIRLVRPHSYTRSAIRYEQVFLSNEVALYRGMTRHKELMCVTPTDSVVTDDINDVKDIVKIELAADQRAFIDTLRK